MEIRQKQKLNHAYSMYVSLPNHHAEAKMKGLKLVVCYNKQLVRKMYPAYSMIKSQ